MMEFKNNLSSLLLHCVQHSLNGDNAYVIFILFIEFSSQMKAFVTLRKNLCEELLVVPTASLREFYWKQD